MASTKRVLVLLLAAVTTAAVLAPTPSLGRQGAEGGGGGNCPQSSLVLGDAQATPDFEKPIGIDVDDDGNVYVADATTKTVYRFAPDGTQTLTIPATAGDPDLVAPTDVAVDDSGIIWVADDGTNRIHKFSAAGSQLLAVDPPEVTPDFVQPVGITVSSPGTTIFVTDPDSETVYRFDQDGNQGLSFAAFGIPALSASGLQAIALDPTGDLVTADQGIDHVFRFSDTGTLELAIPPTAADPDLAAPVGVAVDSARRIWVLDQNGDGVYRFSVNGTQQFFIDGVANGGLTFGRRLAIGRQGDVWATDEVLDTVFRWCFRPDGRISRGAGPFVGDDLVNTAGAGQTRTADLGRGATVTFTVRVDNDGNAHDRVTVRGTAGNGNFRVRYSSGGQDVTTAVVNGTFRTPSIIPGQDRALQVVVTALPGAPRGATRTLSVRLTSFGASPRVDLVKAIVTRA